MRKLLFLLSAASMWCACTKVETTPENVQAFDQSDLSAKATNGTGKRIMLKQGGDQGLYINGKNFSYSPGDTLVLTGKWSYCTLENVCGTAQKYVVIINQGSQVELRNGFSLTNCRFMRVVGAGTKDKYGFRIVESANSGVGITIQGRSSNIEVSRVDIYNKTYGFWVKQEASCADSLQYPNWVIKSIVIHHSRIKKCNQEGMYMGSTDPNGQRAITCNGKTIYPKPLRLGQLSVHDMIIDSTNRSGIQVSCASEGTNNIYNNTITNCGYEYNTNGQGSGISLGGYTTANVYNNTISNTFTMGISSLGAGPLTIRNNKVSNTGVLSGHKANGMASIMIDTRYTSPTTNTTFTVYGNTLGTNSDVNVRVYRTYATYTTNNSVYSNGNATIAVDPNIKWRASK